MATQEGIQILVAAGIGLSLAPPILIIQAATPFADRAACTAFWVLMRSLGATTGLAVLTAILSTGIRDRFEKIDGYGTVFEEPKGSSGYHALHAIKDERTRTQVLNAFAMSMRVSCGTVVLELMTDMLPCWKCVPLCCSPREFCTWYLELTTVNTLYEIIFVGSSSAGVRDELWERSERAKPSSRTDRGRCRGGRTAHSG